MRAAHFIMPISISLMLSVPLLYSSMAVFGESLESPMTSRYASEDLIPQMGDKCIAGDGNRERSVLLKQEAFE